MQNDEPKGIEFFNIKTGDTHYAKLEPTIQAYINSSDMGVNASRGQDMGWRLGASWVKAVRAYRKDQTKMEALAARNGGNAASQTQVLYAIYGAQLRAAQELAEEGEMPFEEQYLAEINSKPAPTEEVEVTTKKK